jgi:uncharacterized membrane protein YphA (DoxX/SURF4 family)
MRTKPLVGRKAWFGPRRMGWGLSPVSVEGWASTVVAVAVAIGLAIGVRRERWSGLVVMALLLIIVFVKGTSPGGPNEWREFQASRKRGND